MTYYSVKLVHVPERSNKRLIIKRLASDLSVDFRKAERLLAHLPFAIVRHATGEEADILVNDYKKMGCVLEKADDPLEKKPEITEAPELPEAIGNTPARPEPAARHDLPKTAVLKQRPADSTSQKREITAAIAVFLLLAGMLWYFSRNQTPDKFKPGSEGRSNQRSSVRGSGSRRSSPPQRPARSAVPPSQTATQLERAAAADSPEKRIGILKSALKDNPSSPAVKRAMARAYGRKAEQTASLDSRIKFYQIALSFNQYNEAAWDGLIQAYQTAGKTAEALTARKRKKRAFTKARANLGSIIQKYGKTLGLPRIRKKTLSITYKTGTTDIRKLEGEMRRLAADVRDVRSFDRVTLTAMTQDGKSVTRSF